MSEERHEGRWAKLGFTWSDDHGEPTNVHWDDYRSLSQPVLDGVAEALAAVYRGLESEKEYDLESFAGALVRLESDGDLRDYESYKITFYRSINRTNWVLSHILAVEEITQYKRGHPDVTVPAWRDLGTAEQISKELKACIDALSKKDQEAIQKIIDKGRRQRMAVEEFLGLRENGALYDVAAAEIAEKYGQGESTIKRWVRKISGA